jgi:hypothetical protein
VINLSLASFPNRDAISAMEMASAGCSDSVLGTLSLNHVQLCPQNCIQKLDDVMCDELKAQYPNTNFRLHANVKVLDKHRLDVDLCQFSINSDYFQQLAFISKKLKASGYSIHVGRRLGTLKRALNKLGQLEDLMETNIGVEGMYPTARNTYFLQDWKEYAYLLESGAKFALDLSHLNIVKTFTGILEDTLVRELLSSEQCMEIHLSHNNGISDTHTPFKQGETVWWQDMLDNKNPNAVVFYEGNFLKP